MTVGLAQKFGRRILMLADTMITDRDRGAVEALPGALKTIILSPTVSVAYAGHAGPAQHAIKDAHRSLAAIADVSLVIERLRDASASSDHQVEFLLAFHESGLPHLHKITSGRVTADLDGAFIGDASVAQAALQLAPAQIVHDHPDLGIMAEEQKLWSAFSSLFQARGVSFGDGVGGLPISLTASPYGHFYNGHASSSAWDVICLRTGVTPAQHQTQRTGQTAWMYNVMGGRLRGVAALGLAVPQAGVGFVYTPLCADSLERIVVPVLEGDGFLDPSQLLSAVSERLETAQVRIGGGVEELA